MLRHHTCAGSGHNITLPSRAFDIPAALEPLLAQLTPERQRELKANPRNLTADELTASIEHLDLVDVDNTVVPAGSVSPARLPQLLRVAELNAERGRYWCEFAVQIRSTPALADVDIWLLNEFDLGMARSEQQHTVRLLAYALGLNYAWSTEFIELTNGNRNEQRRTHGMQNRWGLHGNAARILSSGTRRDIAKRHQFSYDRLPDWCAKMFRRGQSRHYHADHFGGGQASMATLTWRDADQLARRHVQSRERPMFMFGVRPNASNALGSRVAANSSQRNVHTKESAELFFRLVAKHSPMFLLVNDDWPMRSPDYERALGPYHAFLGRAFPQRQPWELDEFIGV